MMEKESNQEREKSKILELENEIFEKIARDHAMEASTTKKEIKRKKGE